MDSGPVRTLPGSGHHPLLQRKKRTAEGFDSWPEVTEPSPLRDAHSSPGGERGQIAYWRAALSSMSVKIPCWDCINVQLSLYVHQGRAVFTEPVRGVSSVRCLDTWPHFQVPLISKHHLPGRKEAEPTRRGEALPAKLEAPSGLPSSLLPLLGRAL